MQGFNRHNLLYDPFLMLKHRQWYLLTHAKKMQWCFMDKHSKVELLCQFRQTFTMVKVLVEMAIKPLIKNLQSSLLIR